jgi:hypothetical protein
LWIAAITLFPCSALHPALLRADGGALRCFERKNGYQVAVFTAPTPPRAGLVDVSVLLLDAAGGEPVADAGVVVQATRPGRPEATIRRSATMETATNKLLRSALIQLPESGWWEFDVTIDGAQGVEHLRFDLEAGEALPNWPTIWPWIAWPAIAVLMFALHGRLKQRTTRKGGTTSK